MARKIIGCFLVVLLFVTGGAASASTGWSFLPGGAGGKEWRLSGKAEFCWRPDGLYLHGGTSAGLEMIFPEGLDAEKFRVFNYRIASGEYGSAWLYFARENEEYASQRRIMIRLKGFENQFSGSADCRSHRLWRGKIRRIRLNPLCRELDHSVIEHLYFSDGHPGAVLNGSFETAGLKEKTLPDQWQFGDGARAWLSSDAFKGSRALRLTGRNEARQQIEFKEQYPAVLTMAHRLQQAGEIELVYYDIFDQKIGERKIALPAGKTWSSLRISLDQPAEAAFAGLVLRSSGGTGDFDDVTVLQPRPRKLQYENWQAFWIWDRQNQNSSEKPVFFRRSFTVKRPEQVAGMLLQAVTRNIGGTIPCDDVKVYVNGRLIDPSYRIPKWSWSRVYDMKPALIAGRNVLALEVTNRMDPGALLAEILLDQSRDGSSRFVRVGTQTDWKVSDRREEGWNRPGFNDGNWRNAMLRGQASPGSFCRIPYRYLGTAGTAAFRKLVFPEQISPLSPFRVSMELELQPEDGAEAVTEDAGLYFHLISRDFSVTSKVKALRLKDCGMKTAGGRQMLPVEFSLDPRYLQEGTQTLRIYLNRLRLTGAPEGFTWNAPGNFIEKQVRVTEKRSSEFPRSRIIDVMGLPRFQINDRVYSMYRFEHGPHTQLTTEKSLEILGKMHSASQPVVEVLPGAIFWEYDADGNCDFSAYDSFIISYLTRYPDGYFNLRWSIDTGGTRGALRKWLLKHPETWARDWKGSQYSGTYMATNVVASMAAPAWRNAIADATRKFVAHLRNSSYADRIVGLLPVCGISSEWLYWGSQSQSFMDYSEPFQQGFRKFLQKKYGSLENLARAWHRQPASWQEVQVPSKKERMDVAYVDFLTGDRHQPVMDLREFLNLTVSDAIIEVTTAVKENSGRRLISGAYYGYNLYVTAPYLGPFSGHYALSRVLDSPSVDVVLSPCRYDDRAFGGGSGSMVALGSLRTRGKIWMNEADCRLLHAWCPSGKVYGLRESRSVMRREFASSVVSGSGMTWYDFGEGWVPDDSRLSSVLQKCLAVGKELADECIAADRNGDGRGTLEFDTDHAIAVVTDEKGIQRTPYKQRLFLNLVGQYPHFLRTGTGVHWYLLEDLEKLRPYRCIVFAPTVTRFTERQQQFIDRQLKNGGRSIVWLYATGVYRQGRPVFDQAGRSGEFEVDVEPGYGKRALRRLPKNHPVLKYLPENYSFSFAEATDFLLTPKAGENAEILFTVGKDRRPGLVRKDFGDWTGYYCASPSLPAPVLRGIAEDSGIRIFNPAEDVTYVSRNLRAVHTINGGKRIFRIPGKVNRVKELFTGQELEVSGGSFEYMLKPGSTVLFRLYQ